MREPQRCRHRTDEPAAATADQNDIGVYGQNDSSVGSRQSGATGPRGLRPERVAATRKQCGAGKLGFEPAQSSWISRPDSTS